MGGMPFYTGETFEESMIPREDAVWKSRDGEKAGIGLLKSRCERIACLVPEQVEELCRAGVRIVVEAGTGEASDFPDSAYRRSGATVTSEKEEILNCGIVLGCEPLKECEIQTLPEYSAVFSFLDIYLLGTSYFRALTTRKACAVALNLIRNEDEECPLTDLLSRASARLMAETALKGPDKKNGTAVIIGAGVAAQTVAEIIGEKTDAIHVFDFSPSRLETFAHRCPKGGVLLHFFHSEELKTYLRKADTVFITLPRRESSLLLRTMGGVSPWIHPEAQVIDIARPGWFCARTLSQNLSLSLSCYLKGILRQGSLGEYARENPFFSKGIYTWGGHLTNAQLSEIHHLPYTEFSSLRGQ